jgi:hypothetical protein
MGWLGVDALKMFAALLRKSAAADLVRRARSYPAPCCRKYIRGRYWHAGDDPSSDGAHEIKRPLVTAKVYLHDNF